MLDFVIFSANWTGLMTDPNRLTRWKRDFFHHSFSLHTTRLD